MCVCVCLSYGFVALVFLIYKKKNCSLKSLFVNSKNLFMGLYSLAKNEYIMTINYY